MSATEMNKPQMLQAKFNALQQQQHEQPTQDSTMHEQQSSSSMMPTNPLTMEARLSCATRDDLSSKLETSSNGRKLRLIRALGRSFIRTMIVLGSVSIPRFNPITALLSVWVIVFVSAGVTCDNQIL
jgi:hypothetical protein